VTVRLVLETPHHPRDRSEVDDPHDVRCECRVKCGLVPDIATYHSQEGLGLGYVLPDIFELGLDEYDVDRRDGNLCSQESSKQRFAFDR
jgi:hypothetical protein